MSPEEQELRIDLAAAFRLLVHFDMHESVANHLSAAVSEDGKHFLMNRKWMHFSNVTASNLQLLDSEDSSVMQSDQAPDPSAWNIHGNVHKSRADARVLLHAHPSYATALSTLKEPRILPIDNNTARFFNRVAYDTDFGGIVLDESEGERVAKAFGEHSIMMMGNHGVSVIGETVADAFENLYYLEKACKTMVLAYSTGQPLNVMNDDLAEQTAASWDAFKGQGAAHFDQLKATLDKQQPDYKT